MDKSLFLHETHPAVSPILVFFKNLQNKQSELNFEKSPAKNDDLFFHDFTRQISFNLTQAHKQLCLRSLEEYHQKYQTPFFAHFFFQINPQQIQKAKQFFNIFFNFHQR
jgi:hypothetical protein